MASPETSPLETISQRLESLEGSIGQRAPPTVASSTSATPPPSAAPLVSELAELVERFKEKEDPAFAAFVERYTELEQYLSTDKALKEILSTHRMKERIVVFAETDIKNISLQLQSLQSLRSALDKDPVPGLPKVQERLATIETTALVRMDDGAKVSADVEAFLLRYNEVIELLNEKFLFYHRKLSEWEALVDRRLEAKGIKA